MSKDVVVIDEDGMLVSGMEVCEAIVTTGVKRGVLVVRGVRRNATEEEIEASISKARAVFANTHGSPPTAEMTDSPAPVAGGTTRSETMTKHPLGPGGNFPSSLQDDDMDEIYETAYGMIRAAPMAILDAEMEGETDTSNREVMEPFLRKAIARMPPISDAEVLMVIATHCRQRALIDEADRWAERARLATS